MSFSEFRKNGHRTRITQTVSHIDLREMIDRGPVNGQEHPDTRVSSDWFSGIPGAVAREDPGIMKNILYGHFGLYGRSLSDIWRFLSFFKSYAYAASMINAKVVASVPLRLYMMVDKGKRPTNLGYRELSPEQKRGFFKRDMGKRVIAAVQRRCRMTADPLLRSQGVTLGKRSHTRAFTREAVTGQDAEVVELTDHPAIDLFHNPNDWQIGSEMLTKMVLYLQFTGNAYLHKERDEFGNVVGLLLLPSQFCWVDVDPNGINGYRIGYAGEMFVPREDIVHLKMPALGGRNRDWSGYIYGKSQVEACLDAVVANEKQHAFDQRWLDNFGTPPFMISFKGTVGEEQRRQMTQDIINFIRNPDNVGVAMVLSDDAQILVPSASESTQRGQIAAASSSGRDLIVQEICACLGVPYAYLSVNQSTAGGVAEQSRIWHLMHTIGPLLTDSQEWFNRSIIPEFDDPRLFYAWDDPMPPNLGGEFDRSMQELDHGVVTINEWRVENGRDPVPWGDGPIHAAGGGQIDDGKGGSGVEDGADGEKPPADDSVGGDDKPEEPAEFEPDVPSGDRPAETVRRKRAKKATGRRKK